MKTHKFRAWDSENKKMIYYTLEDILPGITKYSTHKIPESIRNIIRIAKNGYSQSMRMQYTGMKDMNGTEIYEGDIIRKEMCDSDDPAHGYYGPIGTVIYYEDIMGFIIDTTDDEKYTFYDYMGMNFSWNEIEVIGNIYENK